MSTSIIPWQTATAVSVLRDYGNFSSRISAWAGADYRYSPIVETEYMGKALRSNVQLAHMKVSK